ncbi:MAG: hypothetical protein K6F59_04980 [Gammaproteobacteria bacterium]|nr:hypothetical protein [Gammaproteobacteria bacterium]
MNRLYEIETYWVKKLNIKVEQIKDLEEKTLPVAIFIASYAHKDQRRLNGDYYYDHPEGVLKKYRKFIGLDSDMKYKIDFETYEKNGIPSRGIQELCVLHDVVEDTDFTLDDIKTIFEETDHIDYYLNYIEEPLKILTHDKSVPYDEYLDKVLENRSASIVKMFDMMSNLELYTLDKLGEKEHKRALYYYESIYKINNKYHFIENCVKTKNELKDIGVTYYVRYRSTYPLLAKIVNYHGYKYENGERVDHRYVEGMLYEDMGYEDFK